MEFLVNEVVFAKFFNYNWWPSIINRKILEKNKKVKYEVIFFGDKSSAIMLPIKLKKWDDVFEAKQRKIKSWKMAFKDYDKFSKSADIESFEVEVDDSNESSNQSELKGSIVNNIDNSKNRSGLLLNKGYHCNEKLFCSIKDLFSLYKTFLASEKPVLVEKNTFKNLRKLFKHLNLSSSEDIKIIHDYSLFKLFNSFIDLKSLDKEQKESIENLKIILTKKVEDYLFNPDKILKKEHHNKFKILNGNIEDKNEILVEIYQYLVNLNLNKTCIAKIIEKVREIEMEKIKNSNIYSNNLILLKNKIEQFNWKL